MVYLVHIQLPIHPQNIFTGIQEIQNSVVPPRGNREQNPLVASIGIPGMQLIQHSTLEENMSAYVCHIYE